MATQEWSYMARNQAILQVYAKNLLASAKKLADEPSFSVRNLDNQLSKDKLLEMVKKIHTLAEYPLDNVANRLIGSIDKTNVITYYFRYLVKVINAYEVPHIIADGKFSDRLTAAMLSLIQFTLNARAFPTKSFGRAFSATPENLKTLEAERAKLRKEQELRKEEEIKRFRELLGWTPPTATKFNKEEYERSLLKAEVKYAQENIFERNTLIYGAIAYAREKKDNQLVEKIYQIVKDAEVKKKWND